MLASLGYTEAPSREDADLILFNTCSIRENADSRFIAHLGEAKRLKGEQPGRGRRSRRLLGAVGQGRGLRALPVRRRRLRARPDPQARRFPDQRLADRSGLLRVRGLRRAPAVPARATVPGLGADLPGLQLRLLLLHRPLDARPRGEPPGARAARRGPRSRRRRRPRGDAARPERQQLRARPPRCRAAQLRRAAPRDRRHRRDRADPLHEPAPEGHEGGRDHRPCGVRRGLRAHPPAAAVGLEPDPQVDATHLRPRALPRPGRADPRAPARRRADDRHHRRLPGRDRGGLRGDPRGGRGGRLRRRLHVRLQPPARHRGRRPRRHGCPSGQEGADGTARRGRPAARARARRAVRRADRRGARRRSEPDRSRHACVAAAATTRQ